MFNDVACRNVTWWSKAQPFLAYLACGSFKSRSMDHIIGSDEDQ